MLPYENERYFKQKFTVQKVKAVALKNHTELLEIRINLCYNHSYRKYFSRGKI